VTLLIANVFTGDSREKKAKVLDTLLCSYLDNLFFLKRLFFVIVQTRLFFFLLRDARRPRKIDAALYTHVTKESIPLKKKQFDGLSSPCIHPLLSSSKPPTL